MSEFDSFETLKADIARRGVICPVLVTPDGGLIDGFRRTRACKELGLDPPPRREWKTDSPALDGLIANGFRRSLTENEERELVKGLEAEGLSQREISQATGMSKGTVGRRSSCAPDGAERDRLSKAGGGITVAQIECRRDWAVYLVSVGANSIQIGAALGISKDLASSDLRARDVRLGRGAPRSGLLVNPEPVDWKGLAPAPRPKRLPDGYKMPRLPSRPVSTERMAPTYRDSVTLQLCEEFVSNAEHGNAVNKLAHDALDAQRAVDDEWFSSARRKIGALIEYGTRLLNVIEDENARRRGAQDPNERDDVQRPLRVVRGSIST